MFIWIKVCLGKIVLNLIGIEWVMSLHIHSCPCIRNCHLQDHWKCDYKLVSKVHLTLALSSYSLTFILTYLRYFDKDRSHGSPTVESCVAQFYFLSLQSYNLFADTDTNKCWFGSPHYTSGNFVPSGGPWTVYIKQGTFLPTFFVMVHLQIMEVVPLVDFRLHYCQDNRWIHQLWDCSQWAHYELVEQVCLQGVWGCQRGPWHLHRNVCLWLRQCRRHVRLWLPLHSVWWHQVLSWIHRLRE